MQFYQFDNFAFKRQADKMVDKLSPKTKLLHIISGDLWAGAESQVYNTLYALRTEKQLSIACLLFNDGILKNKLDDIGVKTYLIDESKSHSVLIYLKIYKLFKKDRPSLLHVHHTKEHLLGFLCSISRKARIPLIRTIHGLHVVRPGLPLYQHLRSTIVINIDKILVKCFSSGIIAVSKDLESRLKKKKINAKIYLISNSLNIDHNIRNNNKLDKTIEKYRPHNVFWIGTAARLVGVKNLDMLIDVGILLKNKGIPFQISIFGDGPLRNKLKKRIIEQNIENEVKLHGFVDEMLDIIGALDVFVLCSKHEGLPMALLEAMFLETPVICTNVGGMAEIVEDKINGLLVDSNDINGLSNALLCLFNNIDLRNKIKVTAKQVILKRFSTKKAIEKLISVYEEVK